MTNSGKSRQVIKTPQKFVKKIQVGGKKMEIQEKSREK